MNFIARLRSIIYRNPKDLPPVPRYAVRTTQFLLSTWTEYAGHHGPIRASGLAYSTLFALVPLVVTVFSLFSAFGGLEPIRRQIQEFVFTVLVPTRQDEIIRYIDQFIGNARKLGFAGFLTFAFTSVFLLATIERNFNDIWGSRPETRFIERLTVYTSVLVIGTILIAGSFLFSSWVQTFLERLGFIRVPFAARAFTILFPAVLILGVLVLMIMLVPSVKVQFSSALTGGIIGTVLWEAAGILFKTWVNTSVRNSVVYGSLALIPIFLVWLYVAWNIVLFALSASYVHQNIRRSTAETFVPVSNPSDRLLLGLGLYFTIAESFHRGHDIPALKDLSNRFLVSPYEVDSVLNLFADRRLVLAVEGQKNRFVPARSLETVTVREIAETMLGGVSDPIRSSFGGEPALDIVTGFLGSGYASIEGITVYDIVSSRDHENPVDSVGRND